MKRTLLVYAATTKKSASESSMGIWAAGVKSLRKLDSAKEFERGTAKFTLGSDLTLGDFALLISDARITVTFVGTDAQEILRFLNSWRKALIVSLNQEQIFKSLPWKFSMLGQQDDVAYFELSNWISNQSVYFSVLMNRPATPVFIPNVTTAKTKGATL